MAIAGLSLDLGGTGGWYAQSSNGLGNTIGTKNWLLLQPRVYDFNNAGNDTYPFGIYTDGNNYFLLNHSLNRYPMYVEWKNAGSTASIIWDYGTGPTDPLAIRLYGSGQSAHAVWKNGTAFKSGFIDFGGYSQTGDPAFVTKTSGTDVSAFNFTTSLTAGHANIQRWSTSQAGKSAHGPIVIIQFTTTFTWTDADIERALMDPSSIPDIVTLRGGCSIVHQWDGLTRSGSSIKPTSTQFRTAIANGDVIVDSVGGANMTITAGSGTCYVYPDFFPVGQFASGSGRCWHNANESIGPLCVADPLGGYFATGQVTDASGFGLRFIRHLDANGADDRIPVPFPGSLSYCTDGSGTLTGVTGDITPVAGADADFAGILPEYHHATSISYDGTNIVIVPVRHSLSLLSGAGAGAPVVASKRYNQQAEYGAFVPTSIGDVDALTLSRSLLTRTLAGSGNVTLDYQRICATYAISARVGNVVMTQSRCAGGDSGELIIRKFDGGSETCLRVTTNDLSGSGPWPVATIPISSTAVAFIFVLRNSFASDGSGAGSGIRCLICRDVATFTIATFYNLNNVALSGPVQHVLMQSGADTTGTDISGFGAVNADVGNGSAIGDGSGLIASVWSHGVGNASGYVANNVRYKVNIRRVTVSGSDVTASSSYTLDLTDLFEANVPGFRAASGKEQWSVPRLRWLNSAKTRIGVFLTDPNGATMTEQGSGAGGCPFDDTFGTRVLAIVITNLSTVPTATWYGTFYSVSGSILSVDIPSFAPDAEYTPFLMLQGYVGPTASSTGLGQCRSVPVSLATIDTFAAALNTSSTLGIASNTNLGISISL